MDHQSATGLRALASRDRLARFWKFSGLTRGAKAVIAGIVALFVVIEIVGAIVGATDEPAETTVVQVALTLSFLIFLWHPPAGAFVLQFGALISVALGAGEASILAVAMGTGLVVATCSPALSAAYGLGFIALVGYAEAAVPGPVAFGTVAAFSIVGGISALIGWLLRGLIRRTTQLASDLAERERMLESAVQAERERIADELHDFIAHELTIIAMHARVLEQTSDPAVHDQSRKAIDGSARQALADIRRVLELTQATRGADDEPATSPVETDHRRLLPTLTDVERELRAAGARVELVGAYEAAPRLSRSMDLAMAQFLREATTNVVKHAALGGPVQIEFIAGASDVVMRVRNEVEGEGAVTVPPGGYGIARMHERASVLGGAFSAGPNGSGWLVEVRLPTR
mgnify:FL=1